MLNWTTRLFLAKTLMTAAAVVTNAWTNAGDIAIQGEGKTSKHKKNPERRSDRHLILKSDRLFTFVFLRLDDNVDCISCPTAEDPSQWREVPFN